MSIKGSIEGAGDVGLSDGQVSTLIGRPYAHRQQRQVYEAGRRAFAAIVKQRIVELERRRIELAVEADNLRRWLQWEATRPAVAGPKGYGGI